MNVAIKRLQEEYKNILKNNEYSYSFSPREDNFMIWDFKLIGPYKTIFEMGIFKGVLEFPDEYPNRPPKLRFIDGFFHPNIYDDGKVCISILHEGSDELGYEEDGERWNPLHTVHSIMISILLMLTEPNLESPANVDACKLWRNDYDKYKEIIYKFVSLSLL